jgi:hypothetical protein
VIFYFILFQKSEELVKFTLGKTRGVSHCGLAIYNKTYGKAKEESYGNSNISPCKNIIFKKSSIRNQNPSS